MIVLTPGTICIISVRMLSSRFLAAQPQGYPQAQQLSPFAQHSYSQFPPSHHVGTPGSAKTPTWGAPRISSPARPSPAPMEMRPPTADLCSAFGPPTPAGSPYRGGATPGGENWGEGTPLSTPTGRMEVVNPSTPLSSPVTEPGMNPDEVMHWVTVFGFPRSEASTVVGLFHQFGEITAMRQHPETNWLSIRFQSPLQAQQALAKNGRFLGQFLLGVTAGVPPGLSLSTPSGPYQRQATPGPTVSGPARSLGSESFDVEPKTCLRKRPRAHTSCWHKALEYLCGW
ncbi:putative nuclear pore complex protein Nup53 [Paratrimastix pyriformis]|uniref:Nuclear pore complex protein Nup53 n=1 Tax=Paratrimastix pyriformis TaxID=342808 RepID=A0ABQ8UN55_9EUKA|nr:putative nuclear pore complex protein Nup53 [Paratrimastix pyriformis]